jgi:predicted DNA-binding transcriptional regulator AlpA
MQPELDPFIDRKSVRTATTLSFPTISRMQRRGEFPAFEQISPGRRGLRRSILNEFLEGRRQWDQPHVS